MKKINLNCTAFVQKTYMLLKNKNAGISRVRLTRNTSDDMIFPRFRAKSRIENKLDIFGIDDNRKNLSAYTQKKKNLVVLAKVDGSGKLDKMPCVYISNKEKDEYGDFHYLHPSSFRKYQSPKVAVIYFKNAAELEQLRSVYSKTPLPDFLVNIINKKDCRDTNLYLRNPDLAKFIPSIHKGAHGFFISPNSPYSRDNVLNMYVNAPERLKNNKEGIILCAYAIHPSIKSSFVINQKNQTDQDLVEVSHETRQNVIDEKTNIKSLTSILDLTPQHLPQLRALREKALEHLQHIYHTDSNDSISMFFHFPVAEKTATLHLHIWVNRGQHPMNEARSFELEEIIKHLEDGKRISDLILSRNGGKFHLPISDSIKNISGIPFKGVESTPSFLLLDVNTST